MAPGCSTFLHGSLREFLTTLITLSTYWLWEAFLLPLPAVITSGPSNPPLAIKILPLSDSPRYGLLKTLIPTGRMNPDCPPPYHSKLQPQPWGEHHTQDPHNSPVSCRADSNSCLSLFSLRTSCHLLTFLNLTLHGFAISTGMLSTMHIAPLCILHPLPVALSTISLLYPVHSGYVIGSACGGLLSSGPMGWQVSAAISHTLPIPPAMSINSFSHPGYGPPVCKEREDALSIHEQDVMIKTLFLLRVWF